MKGLYIHIPFCRSKCPYCDFYSCLSKNADIETYVGSVIDEIKTGRRTKDFTQKADLSFDTIYFGGGTPSVIGADNIGKIINCAKDKSAFCVKSFVLLPVFISSITEPT